MRRAALTALLLALCLGAWAWLASLDSVDDLTLASPSEVARAFQDDWSLLWDNAWVTLREVLLGFDGILDHAVLHVDMLNLTGYIEL